MEVKVKFNFPHSLYHTVPSFYSEVLVDTSQSVALLEPDMEQQTGSKLGKEYVKAVYCHPAYKYAEYIMRNSGLYEAQAGIKIAGRNINNLKYVDNTTLMAESKEELNKPLDKGERGE